MRLSALNAYLVFDLTVTLREKVALGMLLLMPAVFYIFFASFYNSPTEGTDGLNFYNNYTVSFASVILLSIALMNLGPMIVACKEGGFYRRLFVTPLAMSHIWLVSVLRALFIFAVGYIEMIVLGYFMFGQLPDAGILNILLPAAISAYALLSLGFLLGAMFNTTMAAYNASMILFQPMLLLSGAGFPLEMMPGWAQSIAYFIPFTYVVDLMRLGWSDAFFTQDALLPSVFLIVMGTVCAVTASHIFKKQSLSH